MLCIRFPHLDIALSKDIIYHITVEPLGIWGIDVYAVSAGKIEKLAAKAVRYPTSLNGMFCVKEKSKGGHRDYTNNN